MVSLNLEKAVSGLVENSLGKPVSLTDRFNPGKVEKLYDMEQEDAEIDEYTGIERDNQDDSQEFKLLPATCPDCFCVESKEGREVVFAFINERYSVLAITL